MPSERSGHAGVEPVQHARDSRGVAAEPGVVRQLSELARELRAEPDMDTLLRHIVTATNEEIAGADHAGISVVEGTAVRAVAPSDPLAERMDQLQNDLNEGPCLSALREQITVRVDDFATDDWWPKFSPAVLDEGIRSMLSVQLFVEGDNLGALNLYADTPNAFTFSDEYTAMAMASHAAVAMKGSRVESNLRTAVQSRDVIGQAKGILMERYKIDADEAFRMIVVASQHTHVKVRDVADHLTVTGELRTTSDRPPAS